FSILAKKAIASRYPPHFVFSPKSISWRTAYELNRRMLRQSNDTRPAIPITARADKVAQRNARVMQEKFFGWNTRLFVTAETSTEGIGRHTRHVRFTPQKAHISLARAAEPLMTISGHAGD